MVLEASVLADLLGQGGVVADYAMARQRGFAPIERGIRWSGQRFAGRLTLRNPAGSQETIQSEEDAFVRLVLDHVWTLSSGVRLRSEVIPDHRTQPASRLSAEVSCGLFRATESQITLLDIRERSTPESSSRNYELQLPMEHVKLLSPVPAGPRLIIRLLRGAVPVLTLSGHVDLLLTQKPEADVLVQLVGGDALTGTRTRIAAAYNCRVNPAVPIFGFAPFIEPEVLNPPIERPAVFAALAQYLSQPVPEDGLQNFREAITAIASGLREEVKNLAADFCDSLVEGHPGLPTAGAAFVNLATVLMHDLPTLYMVVGSVRGVRTEGVVRISPGVVIAAADHMPMHLEGRESGPLCRHWDVTAAHLVTFFLAENAQDTVDKGWTALSEAFDLLCLALSDAGWFHLDSAGGEAPMLLDGRAQDAALELDRHYHVNEVLSGLAHQYHAGVLLSSGSLDLNDLAVLSFRQRLDPLSHILRSAVDGSPRLARQLRQAIGWISRSRRSTTPSEQFICLWIAVESLLVASAQDSSVIKDAVSAGVSRVMCRGDRTARRYWRGIAEEAYGLRNALVHEAQENHEMLQRLTPLLQQAAFEIVWTCALAASTARRDGHPSEFLPQSRPVC